MEVIEHCSVIIVVQVFGDDFIFKTEEQLLEEEGLKE